MNLNRDAKYISPQVTFQSFLIKRKHWENKYTYPAQVALKADKKLTNHWFEKLTEIQTGLVALYKSMGAKGSDERINSVALTSLLILDAQMLNYVNLKNRNLYEQRSSFDSVLLNYLQDIFD